MSAVIKVYKNLLLKFPYGSQAIQTGFLMGCGDLIAQVLIEKKSLREIDPQRMWRFTLVGIFFVGPPLRMWYGVMNKYIGNQGKITAIKKVAADQLLFAPVFLVALIALFGVVEGKTTSAINQQIAQDYVDVLINNYTIWPAVQLINFYWVPLHFQVLTVQIVALFWNAYLSWKMNQSKNFK